MGEVDSEGTEDWRLGCMGEVDSEGTEEGIKSWRPTLGEAGMAIG